MPSKEKKIMMGVGGAACLSIAAWRTMFPWLQYDLQFLRIGAKVARGYTRDMENRRFVIDMFEENVEKQGKKPMIIFEDRIYTWEFINEQAKKVANIAVTWGFEIGDTVALFIQNHPSFVWTFLGLQKVGLAVAFMNFHIRSSPLIHCIKMSKAKAMIIGPEEELFERIDEVRPKLDIPLYLYGTPASRIQEGFISFDDLMLGSPAADICKSYRDSYNLLTPCIYIFTSGTTGLPKAAIFNQAKAIVYSKFFDFCGIIQDDRVYTTLPLYHSAGTLALFSVIDRGGTMVLRRKFSASHFFDDCRRHKVTIAQYIGELARYLLHTPERPDDGEHCIRTMVGNGLRRDIWKQFQKRFKISKIVEFFGATEGTSGFINVNGRVGAVGRLSPLLNRISVPKSYLVRYDPKTDLPYRNKEGRCVVVEIGEPGLMICGIPETYRDGFYVGGKEVNEKKIVRDAFVKGDAFFNYGDLLYYDKDYFLYFNDRVGDTFRWKGENVSTNEVANILTGIPFIQDANVYGVEIPGFDGRAGMAAVLLKDKVEFHPDFLQKIYCHCEENLPSYAHPVFLRFIKEMPLTTTHKQIKNEYVKEGFNPSAIPDPLFHISRETRTYVMLTQENLKQVLKSRL